METAKRKLIQLKLIHTLIWGFFAGLIFYIDYAALANQINRFTWYAIAMVGLESITLLMFKWSCPLTLVAKKYSSSTKDNFDIYLPNWLARHNKIIFGLLYGFGVVLVILRGAYHF
ncbi:hypothetical protein ACUNWD_16780 [Sunxiuqinia sp. A32]|uniref:hypothetical protein n=1 Tax=Sunxiuqinia sp. A32 TaxID=3461496 RepID=UPI004045332E